MKRSKTNKLTNKTLDSIHPVPTPSISIATLESIFRYFPPLFFQTAPCRQAKPLHRQVAPDLLLNLPPVCDRYFEQPGRPTQAKS